MNRLCAFQQKLPRDIDQQPVCKPCTQHSTAPLALHRTWFCTAARCTGVQPRMSLASSSAGPPRLSRTSTTPQWPRITARCSGVRASPSRAAGSAPCNVRCGQAATVLLAGRQAGRRGQMGPGIGQPLLRTSEPQHHGRSMHVACITAGINWQQRTAGEQPCSKQSDARGNMPVPPSATKRRAAR